MTFLILSVEEIKQILASKYFAVFPGKIKVGEFAQLTNRGECDSDNIKVTDSWTEM